MSYTEEQLSLRRLSVTLSTEDDGDVDGKGDGDFVCQRKTVTHVL